MEKHECPICHDPVKVPVSFTYQCFPCRKPENGPGCHDILRVCLYCARTYLQLNTYYKDRVVSRKCLLCPTTTNPRRLRKAKDIYKKDYSYMSRDKSTDYTCFHSECDFKGSQNNLDHHMKHQCLYRTVPCHCGVFYRPVDVESHRGQCPYYTPCTLCPPHTYVLTGEWEKHVRQVHDRVACQHMGCGALFELSALEKHMASECLYRSIVCGQCGELQRMCSQQDHLLRHVQQDQQTIAQLVESMENARRSLDQSLTAYQQWITRDT